MNIENKALINLFEEEILFGITEFDRKKLKFEGGNQKRFFVLCHSESGVLPADEKELLRKILDVFNLNWEDVALIESKESCRFHTLKDSVFFDKLLVLGFSASAIGMNIACENYQVIDFSKTKILFSDSLSLLKENDKTKAQLWKSLKSLFAAA